jgi:hypothetical protein
MTNMELRPATSITPDTRGEGGQWASRLSAVTPDETSDPESQTKLETQLLKRREAKRLLCSENQSLTPAPQGTKKSVSSRRKQHSKDLAEQTVLEVPLP